MRAEYDGCGEQGFDSPAHNSLVRAIWEGREVSVKEREDEESDAQDQADDGGCKSVGAQALLHHCGGVVGDGKRCKAVGVVEWCGVVMCGVWRAIVYVVCSVWCGVCGVWWCEVMLSLRCLFSIVRRIGV